MPAGTEAASQAEIDWALAELRFSTDKSVSPKGAAPGTNDETARAVRDWRYLERLADEGTVPRQTEYGGAGRPSTRYEWR